ncbi:enoyl-CoA hydratase/isomerase family protein [soil metagenome]
MKISEQSRHNPPMLTVETTSAVAKITLARPEVRNALDDNLIAKLTEAIKTLPTHVRAVILSGEGQSFCAGGDLEWMRRAANYSKEENRQDAINLANLFQAICDCPAVIIAKVQGHAFGGGFGLVAACDVAISDPNTLFALSEVRLGLVAATISRFVIPKIGAGHSRALMTTGEAFGTEKALRIGLIHEVTEDLDAMIDKKLKAILAAGPKSVATSKWLAQQPLMGSETSAELLAKVRAGDEAKEGIAAFLEKRKPGFSQP